MAKNKVAVFEKGVTDAPASAATGLQKLVPAGVILDMSGLRFNDVVPIGAWEEIGALLKRIEGGVMWWLGDWLNYGEREYGEKYAQAMDASDYSYQTLNGARWVAENVEFTRRRKELSWSHHREVASLEPKEQDKWLQKAIDNGWTRKELRDAIHGEPEPGEKCVCPTCGASHNKVCKAKTEDEKGAF